jgi:hypothetical protein
MRDAVECFPVLIISEFKPVSCFMLHADPSFVHEMYFVFYEWATYINIGTLLNKPHSYRWTQLALSPKHLNTLKHCVDGI